MPYEISAPGRRRRPLLVFLVGALLILLWLARSLSSYVIDYQWWREMGQVPTWLSLLFYQLAPLSAATLVAFVARWLAHRSALGFAGAGPGRTMPHAAAERGHKHPLLIGGVERDTLDVRERQFIEGSPGFPIVAREPEARAGRVLGQGHVNPAVVIRVEIAAKSLRPFPADALPGLAAVLGEVEAAGLVAPAGIRRTQQDSPAVAGIDGEVLGVEQRLGGIDLFPILRTVFGTIEADAFRHQRLA